MNYLKPKTKHLKPSEGFVLLFALLISSILLATGLGISRIIMREIFLASLARESSVAFFAADTGAECAFHWYYAYKFDSSTFTSNPPIPTTRSLFCNGQAIRDGEPGPLKNTAGNQLNDLRGGVTSTFSFYTSQQSVGTVSGNKPLPCASVTLTFLGTDINDPSSVLIKSKGYNSCDLTKAQTLERTIEYTFVR